MLYDCCASALASIQAHRLRSFLTSLGIIIGVASVIAVVATVQGLTSTIADSFKGLGSNSLTLRSDTSFEEQLQGKQNRLTLADLDKVRRSIDGISSITPSFSPVGKFGTTVKAGNKTSYSRVIASTPSYQDAYEAYTQAGRFLNAADEESGRNVCVIGETLRENLLLPKNPVGQYIQVNGNWFKVVGLAEPRGEILGISQDDYMIIPFSVGLALAGNLASQDVSITFNVDRIEQLEEIQSRVTALLRNAHKLKPGQKNDFKVQTSQQLTESFTQILSSLTVVLVGIVSISLLVGGIGIMNIMLVSVTERTREIGICKALGASRAYILTQFLIEAVAISLIGGVLGLMLGYGLAFVIGALIPGFPAPNVPVWAIALSLTFSSAVGMLFGILPAAKAADLNVIDALRYE
ncbi:hypothetical protein ASF61_14220 [Duganella sp. Leaf126]|nr:hypothetical protein ASF61_14220 [Duganella sp. Leaf126]